jgi:tRNA threonylcarbamoyladenosine biosynthesis protein TsaE
MPEKLTGGQRIPTASDMERLGRSASPGVLPGQIVFLRGALGAGKTTWVRGLLHGLLHPGPVRSPTYTLLEPYYLKEFNVYHFDLYRLNDPGELENLGFRDYLDGSGVCLVEWPERGGNFMPEPDCLIEIKYDNGDRYLRMICATDLGEPLCASLR